VNLQSHNQLASSNLNRDTWTDEAIQSLFNTSFLFWQRGHTSLDGQEYLRLYRVTEDHLPHIAIINPITGAKVKAWTVS
jgi:hypothetical protein